MVLLSAGLVLAVAAAGAWLVRRKWPLARVASEIKSLQRGSNQIKRDLSGHLGRTSSDVNQAANDYALETRMRPLREADIDALRSSLPSGTRLQALRNAGYRTVADLAGRSSNDLIRVYGVGPQTATSVSNAANAYYHRALAAPVAIPKATDPTEVARALYDRACRDILARVEAAAIEEERRPTDQGISEALAKLRSSPGPLKSLLQKSSRAAAVASADEIATKLPNLASGVESTRKKADALLARRNQVLPPADRERLLDSRYTDVVARIDSALSPLQPSGFSARPPERRAPDAATVAAGHASPSRERPSAMPQTASAAAWTGAPPARGAPYRPSPPPAPFRPAPSPEEQDRLRLVVEGVHSEISSYPLNLSGLNPGVSLRGYQVFGTKFLLARRRSILGDDMGLGKTLQALAAMSHLKESGEGSRFLVVCPASVTLNWHRECQRFTRLPAFLLHGAERHQQMKSWAQTGGLAITSYDTFKRLHFSFGAHKIDLFVVDEAHFAKNPDAARTIAVHDIAQNCGGVALLTGTPLENRVREFRNLVGMVQPLLATRLGEATGPTGDLQMHDTEFRAAVAPVYLRRNREDVLSELPDLIEKEEWVHPGAETSAYREAVLSRDLMAMRRSATIGEGASSSKLERLDEILEEYTATGQKVVVFSFFLAVLEAVAARSKSVGTINGSVGSARRLELIENLKLADGHAVLLAQIEAGGVGLNMQEAASTVILMEPQWKPTVEWQAIGRVHRMGQRRSVVVHRLLRREGIDESMVTLLARKERKFDLYARESDTKNANPDSVDIRAAEQQVLKMELARFSAA